MRYRSRQTHPYATRHKRGPDDAAPVRTHITSVGRCCAKLTIALSASGYVTPQSRAKNRLPCKAITARIELPRVLSKDHRDFRRTHTHTTLVYPNEGSVQSKIRFAPESSAVPLDMLQGSGCSGYSRSACRVFAIRSPRDTSR
ncbi:hypothetical protein Cenrod_1116 [Candidatus Symbiobacter mobilis CR]|uniref:Uncharacterized protein n=1 Tax=Candidatus Symbiobacter mobilis CR TaxID=946483 RepID=U5NAI5_9BURK|nr:hypothetical protein Cenrod_1116 [Candidatus Symbiobacter mobilis CR]